MPPRVGSLIVDAARTVYEELGAGLLDEAYEACIVYELEGFGISLQRHLPLPVTYKGRQLECRQQLRLVVDGRIIVQVLTQDGTLWPWRQQLTTLLKVSGYERGLLLNFHALGLEWREEIV